MSSYWSNISSSHSNVPSSYSNMSNSYNIEERTPEQYGMKPYWPAGGNGSEAGTHASGQSRSRFNRDSNRSQVSRYTSSRYGNDKNQHSSRASGHLHDLQPIESSHGTRYSQSHHARSRSPPRSSLTETNLSSLSRSRSHSRSQAPSTVHPESSVSQVQHRRPRTDSSHPTSHYSSSTAPPSSYRHQPNHISRSRSTSTTIRSEHSSHRNCNAHNPERTLVKYAARARRESSQVSERY